MPKKPDRKKIRYHIHAYEEDLEYLRKACEAGGISMAHAIAEIIHGKVRDLRAHSAATMDRKMKETSND